jgi:hypothetical protein
MIWPCDNILDFVSLQDKKREGKILFKRSTPPRRSGICPLPLCSANWFKRIAGVGNFVLPASGKI